MSRPRSAPPPGPRPLLALAALALLSALAVALPACGGAKPDPVADDLARERAAAHFAEESWGAAREDLAPLVARGDTRFEDLIRAAAVEFADGRTEACEALLARADAQRPGAPEVRWLRGQLAREEGGPEGFEHALEDFRAVVAARPDDLPARLALAEAELEAGDPARARELYRSVVEVGLAIGGQWYATAVFRLWNLLLADGLVEEAAPYESAFVQLEAAGISSAKPLSLALGELALVRAPAPRGSAVPPPGPLLPFEARAPLAALASARALELHDLEGDGDLDLVALVPGGLVLALQSAGGFSAVPVRAAAPRLVRAFDLDNDADLDLALVGEDGTLSFLRCEITPEGPSWWPLALELPALPGAPSDLVPVDWDHEGDVDLLLVGPFGARLWRNDGLDAVEAGGSFHDASEGSGLPDDRPFAWGAIEDFDGDNDVDLLLGGPEGLVLASSLRGGRFELVAAFPPGARLALRPVLADLDGDARPDLWPVGAEAPWLQQADGRFAAGAAERPERAPHFLAADIDLDGALDLLGVGADDAPSALLAAGLAAKTSAPLQGLGALPAQAPLVCGDLDGDRVPDLAASTPAGLVVFAGAPLANEAKRLALRGVRDNRRALGAIVEYRVGPLYRRIFWRGEPELLGAGRAERLDVLRVSWPNGVISTRLDVGLDEPASVGDPDAAFDAFGQGTGQAGSCPFLYTWNGERFEFVSDVLGITPLGLPMAPGMLVPPDHDEYVLVRGAQLAPKDGELALQLTEELREVTYLDQVRLIAVDHPAGVRVFPNERFTFPPFPEPHVHTVAEAHPPRRATDSEGRDWTAALARVDGVHAEPFELEAPQYGGLAKPYWIELEFDPAKVRDAKRLRLLMTGWFFWSDASANMASARHPTVAFVPPILQVPDAASDGGWRDAGPPVGFPAGKTKTMVIDLSSMLSRDDPRLRITSTLRLYWDAIELATDGDDAELVQTTIEPASARLWRRGFSAPLEPDTPYGEAPASPSTPERFDWDALADPPRWNPHPGLYTRYGACRELVDAVDDRFAILGAGDALELRFPAAALPPLRAGFARDWLVFLDGWAKDRDPNTIEALNVEPLPFHGMSGYPYRPDERFPDDEAHRLWRQEWLTRAPEPWILPLSLVRQHEALLPRAR